ncbi:hypothetical protein CAPTEDRAFT_214859 [Capitella teleta]|uniref:Uncharacterized protein n=1 Tax=Capitella teleta TaxID=283909 RepID=R7U4G4_CAPTE|nr:hypothetical protein CAPTEDRAFT_214859 [Capitella teleta]|eukprot:ELU00981.1 hypothetical protein CAPTEDRAFT_214859 [Capitella teleta]
MAEAEGTIHELFESILGSSGHRRNEHYALPPRTRSVQPSQDIRHLRNVHHRDPETVKNREKRARWNAGGKQIFQRGEAFDHLRHGGPSMHTQRTHVHQGQSYQTGSRAESNDRALARQSTLAAFEVQRSIINSGHRSGVVRNMTVEEVDLALMFSVLHYLLDKICSNMVRTKPDEARTLNFPGGCGEDGCPDVRAGGAALCDGRSPDYARSRSDVRRTGALLILTKEDKTDLARFDWQHPGVVFFKRRINDEEGSFQVFKETTLPTTAAAAITPQGGRMHLEERKGATAVLQLNDGQMISELAVSDFTYVLLFITRLPLKTEESFALKEGVDGESLIEENIRMRVFGAQEVQNQRTGSHPGGQDGTVISREVQDEKDRKCTQETTQRNQPGRGSNEAWRVGERYRVLTGATGCNPKSVTFNSS